MSSRPHSAKKHGSSYNYLYACKKMCEDAKQLSPDPTYEGTCTSQPNYPKCSGRTLPPITCVGIPVPTWECGREVLDPMRTLKNQEYQSCISAASNPPNGYKRRKLMDSGSSGFNGQGGYGSSGYVYTGAPAPCCSLYYGVPPFTIQSTAPPVIYTTDKRRALGGWQSGVVFARPIDGSRRGGPCGKPLLY